MQTCDAMSAGGRVQREPRADGAGASPLATDVFLNRYDPTDDVHRRNRAWLADRHGLEIATDRTTLEALCRP
jgi:hypothetical protein